LPNKTLHRISSQVHQIPAPSSPTIVVQTTPAPASG
jgi:hypothetical protein